MTSEPATASRPVEPIVSRLCETCRHWVLPKDRYNDLCLPCHPGTFTRVKDEREAVEVFGHRVRYCTHPKVLFYQRPERDGAAVVDGSEYAAELLTAEKFGCVLHEPVDG